MDLDHRKQRKKMLVNQIRLPILQESRVVLNSPKCEIIKTQISYLGFSISLNKISVKQSYLGKISDWPEPQSLKNLESFLGFLSYYASLIPYFSQGAFHLSELRRLVRNKKIKLEWSPLHKSEFDDLKKALLSSPCVGFPSMTSRTPKFPL